MKSVFFNNEVLEAEKNIIKRTGIPSIVLMENAGKNISEFILKNFLHELKKPVTILAGKGNNAGDGFVIARHLINAGKKVNLINVYPSGGLKGDAKLNYGVLLKLDAELLNIFAYNSTKDLENIIEEESIIVDAVFGVGFKGKLDEETQKIVKFINALKNKKLISVDIPSGLERYNSDGEMFKASHTIAVGVKKFDSMFYEGKAAAGKYSTVNIGIPGKLFDDENKRKIFEVEEKDVISYRYKRKASSHKYSNGKLLIIGGSKGLSGALYMSSNSAMRAGSGAVIAAFPESLDTIIESKSTEIIKLALPETSEQTIALSAIDKLKERFSWADAILIGPGISKNDETMEVVRHIVKNYPNNYVLDAEATFAFKDHLNILKAAKGKIILTPHMAEFARINNTDADDVIKDFYNVSTSFAKRNKVTLVLKNAPTIITNGDFFYINSTGRENLATAGTGDVLSGITASLLSQNKKILEAAIAGTYIHGLCGDILYEKTGADSTIATDLIDVIPKVKNRLYN